ncbi:MAG: GxxExxY protein [Acidobacteria bacterium]|nr:MAG: GxxExxY protein [Acidobacteriota bacterium]
MLTDPHGTNLITRAIIGCGIRVHDVVGPGVFENVYEECMAYELTAEKLQFELQRRVPIIYKGVQLKTLYYIDIVIEGCVVVELKSVQTLMEIHRRQVLTQLKLANLPVGLLINFNVVRLVDGVKRVVNPKMRIEGVTDDPV